MAKVTVSAKHLLALCERASVAAKRRERSVSFPSVMDVDLPSHSAEIVQREFAHLTTVANRAIELAGAGNAFVTLEEREVSSLEWALGL